MSPFRVLSVLSRSCIVLKRLKILPRFFYDSPVSLPDIFKKNLANIGQPIPPQILPNDLPAVDLSVGDIRWQIAAEWLQIATVTMESL